MHSGSGFAQPGNAANSAGNRAAALVVGSRRRGGFLVLQQRQFDRRGRRSGGIVLLDKCTGQGQGCFTAKPGRTSIAFAAKARLSVNYPSAREIETCQVVTRALQ